MPIIEQQCVDIPSLVEAVLAITAALPPDSFLWFRGHPRADYKLSPSIMRNEKTSDQVFDREKRLITRFRQRSLAYWPAGYPQTDWEHLFAMQHHGMPTRLLDWSENLFVAAYFALTGNQDEKEVADKPPVIWCLNPIQWNRAAPPLSGFGETIQVMTTSDEEVDSYRPDTTKRRARNPIAIFGTHNSARIVAQRGTFMIWGNDARPLEDFSTEENAAGKLWKLTMTGNRKTLSESMKALGFGETMIFPELTALARELSIVEGWR